MAKLKLPLVLFPADNADARRKKGVIYLKSVGHRGFLFPQITQMLAEKRVFNYLKSVGHRGFLFPQITQIHAEKRVFNLGLILWLLTTVQTFLCN